MRLFFFFFGFFVFVVNWGPACSSDYKVWRTPHLLLFPSPSPAFAWLLLYPEGILVHWDLINSRRQGKGCSLLFASRAFLLLLFLSCFLFSMGGGGGALTSMDALDSFLFSLSNSFCTPLALFVQIQVRFPPCVSFFRSSSLCLFSI